MSTVQNILDFMQYRPDIQVKGDDLIHVVNGAVQAIAKRLYLHKSSLIVDEMEVSIFAEVSYTASIAITSAGFTDAAAQFVAEGFEANMPISCTDTTYTGTYKISTVAVGAITVAETLGTVVAASMTITSDASFGYLPDDFWGLVDKPYIDGKKYPLRPLPSVDTKLTYTTGDPIFYKIKKPSRRIYVTPETGSDYTIKADYFQQPTALTAAADTIPWDGLFDDLISDYIVSYFRGIKSSNEFIRLTAMLNSQVDLIALKHDKVAPVAASGIDWSTMNDG